jgi:hypothetical protein
MRKYHLKHRTRGCVNRYREWLQDHPEMLAIIAEELKGKDLSEYSPGTLARITVVNELLEAQAKAAK